MNDLISRQDVICLIRSMYPSSPILPSNRRKWEEKYKQFIRVEREISNLPSAQPETFEWCHDCKEYDQEQHCCHRWSQQIRKTIEELEANYPQEAKDELQYWKERAAKLERDYYIKIKGIRKHVPNIDPEEVEEDEIN